MILRCGASWPLPSGLKATLAHPAVVLKPFPDRGAGGRVPNASGFPPADAVATRAPSGLNTAPTTSPSYRKGVGICANRGALIGTPMRHEGEVVGAVFSPDGARVATASVDKKPLAFGTRPPAPLSGNGLSTTAG